MNIRFPDISAMETPPGPVCTAMHSDFAPCSENPTWHIWIRGTERRLCVRACDSHMEQIRASWWYSGAHRVTEACLAASGCAAWQEDGCVELSA